MGTTRDLFKNIRDTKGKFPAKMGTIKDRNGIYLTGVEPGGLPSMGRESDTTEATQQQQQQQKQKILRRGGKNTQKNYTKKIFMIQIITMV